MEKRHIRLVSIGADHLTGVGDPRALGWLGRVLAKTDQTTAQIESYVLAAPHESLEELSTRWEAEARPRFSYITENKLLIALGDEEIHREGADYSSTARARLNMANIVDRALQRNISVLVVGPPALSEPELNDKLRPLNAAYQDVAHRRGVTYVDTLTPLEHHDQYQQDLVANDGLPGQAAYGLIAWLVLHRGWFGWLNLPDPSVNA